MQFAAPQEGGKPAEDAARAEQPKEATKSIDKQLVAERAKVAAQKQEAAQTAQKVLDLANKIKDPATRTKLAGEAGNLRSLAADLKPENADQQALDDLRNRLKVITEGVRKTEGAVRQEQQNEAIVKAKTDKAGRELDAAITDVNALPDGDQRKTTALQQLNTIRADLEAPASTDTAYMDQHLDSTLQNISKLSQNLRAPTAQPTEAAPNTAKNAAELTAAKEVLNKARTAVDGAYTSAQREVSKLQADNPKATELKAQLAALDTQMKAPQSATDLAATKQLGERLQLLAKQANELAFNAVKAERNAAFKDRGGKDEKQQDLNASLRLAMNERGLDTKLADLGQLDTKQQAELWQRAREIQTDAAATPEVEVQKPADKNPAEIIAKEKDGKPSADKAAMTEIQWQEATAKPSLTSEVWAQVKKGGAAISEKFTSRFGQKPPGEAWYGTAAREAGAVFGFIGDVAGSAAETAGQGLSKLATLSREHLPVVGHIIGSALDVSGGAFEGAGALAKGLGSAIEHPLDAATGIGAMAGRDPATGECSLATAKNTWEGIAKDAVAYDEFAQGNISRGIGKTAINVLTSATGIGAAAKGLTKASKAAEVSRLASAIEGHGAVRSAITATARGTAVGAGTFAKEFVVGLADAPVQAWRMGKELAGSAAGGVRSLAVKAKDWWQARKNQPAENNTEVNKDQGQTSSADAHDEAIPHAKSSAEELTRYTARLEEQFAQTATDYYGATNAMEAAKRALNNLRLTNPKWFDEAKMPEIVLKDGAPKELQANYAELYANWTEKQNAYGSAVMKYEREKSRMEDFQRYRDNALSKSTEHAEAANEGTDADSSDDKGKGYILRQSGDAAIDGGIRAKKGIQTEITDKEHYLNEINVALEKNGTAHVELRQRMRDFQSQHAEHFVDENIAGKTYTKAKLGEEAPTELKTAWQALEKEEASLNAELVSLKEQQSTAEGILTGLRKQVPDVAARRAEKIATKQELVELATKKVANGEAFAKAGSDMRQIEAAHPEHFAFEDKGTYKIPRLRADANGDAVAQYKALIAKREQLGQELNELSQAEIAAKQKLENLNKPQTIASLVDAKQQAAKPKPQPIVASDVWPERRAINGAPQTSKMPDNSLDQTSVSHGLEARRAALDTRMLEHMNTLQNINTSDALTRWLNEMPANGLASNDGFMTKKYLIDTFAAIKRGEAPLAGLTNNGNLRDVARRVLANENPQHPALRNENASATKDASTASAKESEPIAQALPPRLLQNETRKLQMPDGAEITVHLNKGGEPAEAFVISRRGNAYVMRRGDSKQTVTLRANADNFLGRSEAGDGKNNYISRQHVNIRVENDGTLTVKDVSENGTVLTVGDTSKPPKLEKADDSAVQAAANSESRLSRAWGKFKALWAKEEKKEVGTLKPIEVVRGPVDEIASNRLDAPKVVQGKHGRIAYGTDEGIAKRLDKPNRNEDAVVINTEANAFASIDGMGGTARGQRAAQILAEEIQKGFRDGIDPETIQVMAHRRMEAEGMYESGACYVSGKITGNRLDIAQAGDVRLIIIGRDGKVRFATRDEGIGAVVSNAVQGHSAGKTTRSSCELQPGDRIIAASDGLWDNLSSEQVASMIDGRSSEDAIMILNEATRKKMKDRAAGRSNEGKPDNMNIIIYDYENPTPAGQLNRAA